VKRKRCPKWASWIRWFGKACILLFIAAVIIKLMVLLVIPVVWEMACFACKAWWDIVMWALFDWSGRL